MGHMVHAAGKHIRLARFVITGGVAAAVEYGVFMMLHALGLHILLANTLSFLCGLGVSFSLNRLWVFRSKAAASTQFGMYFTLAIVNLLISDALIWLGVNKLSIYPLYAKLITMVLIAAWNYGIYRKIIFVHQGPN